MPRERRFSLPAADGFRRTHRRAGHPAWCRVAGHPADEHRSLQWPAGPGVHRHRRALAGHRLLGRCLCLCVRAGQVLHPVLAAVRRRLCGDGAARRRGRTQFHSVLPAPQRRAAADRPVPRAAGLVRRHPGDVRADLATVAGLPRGTAQLAAVDGRDRLPRRRGDDAAGRRDGVDGLGRRGAGHARRSAAEHRAAASGIRAGQLGAGHRATLERVRYLDGRAADHRPGSAGHVPDRQLVRRQWRACRAGALPTPVRLAALDRAAAGPAGHGAGCCLETVPGTGCLRSAGNSRNGTGDDRRPADVPGLPGVDRALAHAAGMAGAGSR
ncbi:hypothetical protein G6F35_013095 [Rhizopus arrhizus]|nr:hypothetical protein G6F35_013095 [Rhizopus arrhizus]